MVIGRKMVVSVTFNSASLRKRIIRSLLAFTTLVLLWILLTGSASISTVVVGEVCVVLTLRIIRKMQLKLPSSFHYLKPAALLYWLWLLKEIILSGLRVTRLVWQAEPHTSPTLAWIPTQQTTDRGKTIFGNSITLTPGTVTLDVQGAYMVVHALEQAGAESLKEGAMDQQVHRMIHRIA